MMAVVADPICRVGASRAASGTQLDLERRGSFQSSVSSCPVEPGSSVESTASSNATRATETQLDLECGNQVEVSEIARTGCTGESISSTDLKAQDDAESADSSSLASSENPTTDSKLSFNLFDPWNLGLTMHYFSQGLVFGITDAAMQGLVFGYFNVPSYLAGASMNVSNLPSIFSFLFGMISDAKPIFGLRRRPYMVLGWVISCVALCLMTAWPMPRPYWCVDADGTYRTDLPPCNPDARKEFVPDVLLIGLLILGAGLSSAAADGLLVEYAKMESEQKRGSTQTLLQMIQMCARFLATTVCAFGFNGKEYTGSWDQRKQLSFQQLTALLIVPTGVTLCLCCFCVREPRSSAPSTRQQSLRSYFADAVRLLRSKAFFFIVMYVFWNSSIFDISTPAGSMVSLHWAGVKTLQRQLCNLFGIVVSILGMWLARTYFLNTSWRKIMAFTVLTGLVSDAIPQFLTVFNVVRNQYFYLGEPILDGIPDAVEDLVSMLMINELADASNAGLVSGVISTISCLADPLSTVLGNQLFGLFPLDLSDEVNYLADTAKFRNWVAISFVVSYLISLASLSLLPLLPDQKQELQQRKQEWPSSRKYAYIVLALSACAFVYSLLVDFLSMEPSLACMRFVGGPGC